MGEALALLAGLFYSSGNLMSRHGMKIMDRTSGQLVTLFITGAMNVIALLIMAAFALLPQVNFWGLFYFSLAGVFTTFAGRLFLFASIERIGATRAGLFKVSAPMFTIFLGITILGEHLSTLDYLGSAVVLTGLYFLSTSRDIGIGATPPLGIVSHAGQEEKPFILDIGVVFGALSGIFLSIGHLFRKLGLLHIESPVLGVATGTLVSLLCFSAYFLYKTKDAGKIAGLAKDTVCFDTTCRSYMWGGFFSTFAQYLFFLSLLYTTVSVANILISTEALFNLLLVALFFRTDEPVTPRLVFLSFFVLAGVILIII